MKSLWAAALLLCAASARAAELPWSPESLNESARAIRAARGAGKEPVVVPVSVAVVAGAKVDESRLSWELYIANNIYNGRDPFEKAVNGRQPLKKGEDGKPSADCGVVVEYQSGRTIEADVPKDLANYDHGNGRPSEGYYSNTQRLSEAEMRLLDAVAPAPAGGLLIVYLPALGGGHGYAYNKVSLYSQSRGMQGQGTLPKGMTADALVEKYKNIVLMADAGNNETLAHEIGHILTNRGHETAPGNLMRTGGVSGGGDGLLLERQCSSLRGRARQL